jgi:type I restriction enzyme M protein
LDLGHLKRMKDIMRPDSGVNGNIQRIETISWMLFLKIWDSREKDLEITESGFLSPLTELRWMNQQNEEITEDLRWRSWAANPEGITGERLLDFVNDTIFPAIQNSIIPDISSNASQNYRRKRMIMLKQGFSDSMNYMRDGIAMRQLLNYIHEHINYDSTEMRDSFGDMYESFLNDLQSAKDSGEFYTPRAVTQLAVEMVNPKLGESVLDPACGTGGFLTSAIHHIRSKFVTNSSDEEILQRSISGIEKKQLPTVLCMTNFIHHGIDNPGMIKRGNTLSRPISSYTDADEVDVIFSNPPFAGSEQASILSNFPSMYRLSETADLFMTVIHTYLKVGGRAAIIYPTTPKPDGKKQNIVRRLVEDCNLHTIIQLPKSTFAPYATIPTNILFFTKGEPTVETWFFQHKIPEGYKAYSKTKPIKSEDFESLRNWWSNREESEQAWKVGIGSIVESGYSIFNWKNPNTLEKEIDSSNIMQSKYDDTRARLEEARNNLIEEIQSILNLISE